MRIVLLYSVSMVIQHKSMHDLIFITQGFAKKNSENAKITLDTNYICPRKPRNICLVVSKMSTNGTYTAGAT